MKKIILGLMILISFNINAQTKIYEIINKGKGVITEIAPADLLLIRNDTIVSSGGGSQDLQDLYDDNSTIISDVPLIIQATDLSTSISVSPQSISILNTTTSEQFQFDGINKRLVSSGDDGFTTLNIPINEGQFPSFTLPINNTGSYTLATLDDVTNINTTFNEVTYASTISHAFDSDNPNIYINVTGNLDLTYTGTANGDSGLVNLYFSGTEVATLNGVTDLVITGAGEMIPVYFIHDNEELRWYRTSIDENLNTILNKGIPWVKTEDGFAKTVDFSASGVGGSNSDILIQTVEGTTNNQLRMSTGINLSSSNSSTGITNSVGATGFSKSVSGGFGTYTVLDTPTVNSILHFPAPTVAGDYNLLLDAPIDGAEYIRKDGEWVESTEGGSIDTSNLAVQDGTILYHIATATTTGTVTSSGTSWTGTGTEITDEMVGAKITVDGQTTFIDTVDEGAQTFTTVDAIPATGETFEVRCKAAEIKSDGNIFSYSSLGTLFSESKIYNIGGDKSVEFSAFVKAQFFTSGQSNIYQDQIFIGTSAMKSDHIEVDYIRPKVYLFSALPTGIPAGTQAMISDATTPSWHGIAVGGGTTLSPVYFDGTNWLYY